MEGMAIAAAHCCSTAGSLRYDGIEVHPGPIWVSSHCCRNWVAGLQSWGWALQV